MMFSIITMASSTTKPVEMVRAMSVRLLRLYPIRYMTPKVPTSDMGTAMLGMMVAETLRRNRKMTITTSPTVSISSNSTSSTEARMVVVRSVRMAISTEVGRELRRAGSSFFTRSTTSMMLAPGWRWMLRMTAGTSFIQAAWRTFSAPSTTVATSESRTGAPLR